MFLPAQRLICAYSVKDKQEKQLSDPFFKTCFLPSFFFILSSFNCFDDYNTREEIGAIFKEIK